MLAIPPAHGCRSDDAGPAAAPDAGPPPPDGAGSPDNASPPPPDAWSPDSVGPPEDAHPAGDPGPPAPDAIGEDTAEPAPAEGPYVGGIVVLLHGQGEGPAPSVSQVEIWPFHEEPWPGDIFAVLRLGLTWEQAVSIGDCAWVAQKEPNFCEPICSGMEYCNDDEECVLSPEEILAGTLALDGLKEPLTIEPNEYGSYSWFITSGLPPGIYEPGQEVTLTASGGVLPAFTVSATGPEALAPGLACDLELQKGKDLELTWTPSGAPGARIRWEMITMMHAGNGPMVLCETDDDGALTVPAELVDLYLADATPYETYQLSRFRRATAEPAPGKVVALELSSKRACYHYPGEGGGGAKAGVVVCGDETECPLPDVCCAQPDWSVVPTTCGPECQEGVKIRCDGPEDCDGQVCCAHGTNAFGTVELACVDPGTCTMKSQMVCHTPSDCPPQQGCAPMPGLSVGYSVCVP